jgi:hypothetical protein
MEGVCGKAMSLERILVTRSTPSSRCEMLLTDLSKSGSGPDSPIAVAWALPRQRLQSDINRMVDGLEANELEQIRLKIRGEFYRGLAIGRWRSKIEFGEEVFPQEENPKARQNTASRLLNNPFKGTKCGYTREIIISVGKILGFPVNDYLHQATSMTVKRNATARLVLPEVKTVWKNCFGDCPQLPILPSGELSQAFSAAIGQAGMPAPQRFLSLPQFNDEVEAVRGWA